MHVTSGIRSRIRGFLRLAGAALGRPLTGPRIVNLEVTHYCNLNCGFCETHGRFVPLPVHKRREYVDGRYTMDLADIERVTRTLAGMGVEWVELSGKGDPIVHPQLPEIVRAIRAAGLRCSMFTNGSVRRPGLVQALVESGLERLNVSLNAGTPEVYERVAGKPLFDTATGFVRELLELRRASGRAKPWVRLTTVVCKDNAADVGRIVELCRTLGVDEGGWCVMGTFDEVQSIQLERAEADLLLAGLPGWRRELEEAHIVHDLDSFEQDLRLRVGADLVQDNPLQRSLPCYEGWMHAIVAPDGAVTPCCYCDDVPLGNARAEGFDRVWRGAAYQDFRQRALAIPASGRPICKECFTSCNKVHENGHTHRRLQRLFPGVNGKTGRAPSGGSR